MAAMETALYIAGMLIVVASLAAWIFLSVIRISVRRRMEAVLAVFRFELSRKVDSLAIFRSFYLGNAGIYYYKYLARPAVKLAMRVLIYGGWLCVPIFFLAVYYYGPKDPLAFLPLIMAGLKLLTGTEEYYSDNAREDHLVLLLLERQKKEFYRDPSGGEAPPAYGYSLLSEADARAYHELSKLLTARYALGKTTLEDAA